MRFNALNLRIAFAPENDGGGAGGGGGGASPPPPPAAPPAQAGADWSASLDDGAKALIGTRGWAGKPIDAVLPEVFTSYRELEGLVGTSVKIPGADAKPEDWASFNKKIGVPDGADGYKFAAPANGGQYSEADLGFQKALAPILHGAGLSQRQVDALVPAWNQLQASQAEARNQAAGALAEGTKTALTQEWKGEENYNKNIGLANGAFRTLFGNDLAAATEIRLADGTFFFDNPVVAKAFAKLGVKMSEDGTLSGDAHGGGAVQGDAKTQLDAIYAEAAADPKHPYNNPADPLHKAVQDKIMNLAMAMAGAQK